MALEQKKKWWFLLGMSPIIALGVFSVFALSDFDSFVSLFKHPGRWVLALSSAFAVLLGATITFAVLNLMSRAAVGSKIKVKVRSPQCIKLSYGIVLLMVLFGLAPVVVSFALEWIDGLVVTGPIMYILNLLCFAPIFVLLLWLLGVKPTDGVGKKKRPVWFILATVCLALALMTLVGDFGNWVGRAMDSLPIIKHTLSSIGLSFIADLVKRGVVRVALFATLMPMAMVFYAIWMLFGSRTMDRSKKQQQQQKTVLSKVRSWIKRIFTGESRPQWIDDFAAQISNVCDGKLVGGVDVRRRSISRASAPLEFDSLGKADCERAKALWLLMGRRADAHPTESQYEFFKQFHRSYNAALDAHRHGNSLSADMILEGDEGAGRTELLLACALFSAIVRRQNVLFVVPDSDQANEVVSELRKRLSGILMDAYISCGRLDREQVRAWCAGNSINPDIIVATPRELESYFWGNDDLAIDRRSIGALARIIRCYEVVLIDDLLEVPLIERWHLIFSLHKLRLLFAHGGGLSQVVVSVPLLSDAGRSHLSSRLFGITSFKAENAMQIIPRKCEDPWCVHLKVKGGVSPNEICVELVRKCLEIGWSVVIYRKGISAQQCQKVKEKICTGIGQGKLEVVSRLRELRGILEPKAVFYLTALSGDAVVSLRLNMNTEETVFVGIEGPDTIAIEKYPIIPTLPDNTAHALRIYHLKSLLPFIVRNEPMDQSVWHRFGLFDVSNKLPIVVRESNKHPSETWEQDVWDEKDRYGKPLWPYVVLKDKGTTSNAGFKLDTSMLPFTTDDLYEIQDTHQVVLGNLIADGDASCNEISSIAKWCSADLTAFCDLSHVTTLRIGKTADGDITSAGGENVFKVRLPFRKEENKEGHCLLFTPMSEQWQGDGTDLDIPVRSFKWTIESISVPEVSVSNDAFLAFNLRESRGIHRIVDAVIHQLISIDGQKEFVRGPCTYNYKAFISGIVLNPYKLSDDDFKLQIQRFASGEWSTSDCPIFSPLLTYVFSTVLRRIMPEFPQVAICPAFHVVDRDGAIGRVCFWLLQPTNSGKIVNDFLAKLLSTIKPQKRPKITGVDAIKAGMVDAETFVMAMLETIDAVKNLYVEGNEKLTNQRRLHWLRMSSGFSYYCSLETDEENSIFSKDIEESYRVLKELCDVLRNVSNIKIDAPKLPSGDTNWIMARKRFEMPLLQADIKWECRGALPKGMNAGRGALEYSWSYHGKQYSLSAGFDKKEDHDSYNVFLDRFSAWRIPSDNAWSEYGYNDPYRDFVDGLYNELKKMYDADRIGSSAASFAEFLLSFVQASIQYVKDPKDASHQSDWPRFPSETCSLKIGDCEDTSILYIELLRRAKIESALLLIPRHAAVGVVVEMVKTGTGKDPIKYSWKGKDYVYAETACSAGKTRVLGDETSLISSAEKIPAVLVPTIDFSRYPPPRVCVLTAKFDRGNNTLDVSIACPNDDSIRDDELSVVCYLRYAKDAFEEPAGDYKFVGGAKIVGCKSGEVMSATIKVDVPFRNSVKTRWLDMYICENGTGDVCGHYVGVFENP